MLKEFLSCLPVQCLPPYSPFLNPIEELFSQWKMLFKRCTNKSLSDVLNNVFNSFKKLEYRLIPKLFSHSLQFYPIYLRGLPVD